MRRPWPVDRSGGTAVLVLLVMAVATVVSADWRQEYRDGITAADSERWSEVEGKMERAIAENPGSSDQRMRIYGMRFEVYTPHFWLALARFEQSDCTRAMAALEIALSHGVIQGTTHMSDIRRIQDECASAAPTSPPATATTIPATPTPRVVATPAGPSAADLEAARRAAENAVDLAETAQSKLEQLGRGSDAKAVLRQDGELREAVARVARDLATAQESVRRGVADRDLDALRRAREMANTVRGLADRTTLEIAALMSSAAPPTATAPPARTLAPTATPTTTPTPRPTLAPPVEPPARPESLLRASQRWLAGDPAGTLAALDGEVYTSGRATAVAEMLRAAAHWSLWRESGGADTSQRDAADAAVRAARRADTAVAPGVDAFSPAFVRFFDMVAP